MRRPPKNSLPRLQQNLPIKFDANRTFLTDLGESCLCNEKNNSQKNISFFQWLVESICPLENYLDRKSGKVISQD
jgi:hypothetical protein